MSEKVELLIRSASSNKDLKLEGNLDETILQVKQQIEREWPFHPPPEDQRLVYSGKLLQDASMLKEVLRLGDHSHPFIIHLVCKMLYTPSASTDLSSQTEDGLRRRANGTSAQSSQTQSARSSEQSQPLWMPSADTESQHDQAAVFNQVVAVQQMYAQYMNHYMQYISSAGNPIAASAVHLWANQAPHEAQEGPGNVLEPMAAAAAAATAAVAGGRAAVGMNHAAGAENHPDVDPAVVPQVEGNLAVAGNGGAANIGPPNVVMNANAGGLGAIEDEEDGVGGQRDILDWFYVASRVLVLFSIVYFYSSFARFALVAGAALVLYLYQIGFFGQQRAFQQAQEQQQDGNQNQDLIQQQVDEVRHAAGGGEAEHRSDGELTAPNYFSVLITFISTFFSSLIPQEPQVV